ncbi:MAG TPA: hypothetical protein VN257_08520 [Actinotalea sp.]|nr:hypothetical protein [Actinotalea sp.]
MRPVPTDFARYRRLRWTARGATVGVALLIAALVRVTVVLAGLEPEVSRAAILPFLLLCATLVAAGRLLWTLWRRSFAARPVVQSLAPTPGEVYGIPELDAEPPRHRGLAGEVDPPTRW